jgi:hypothetical protein
MHLYAGKLPAICSKVERILDLILGLILYKNKVSTSVQIRHELKYLVRLIVGMQIQQLTRKEYILYCSLAGFIASWAISGMLAIVDYYTGTRVGTFFAVIGISLGFTDPEVAQYVGFALHVLTGMTAGNIFGQVSMFWPKMSPFNVKRGIVTGIIVGIVLWAALFVPLASLGIQPRLDLLLSQAPNDTVSDIARHFEGTFYLIVGGALVFHIAYGVMLGLIAGRLSEIRYAREMNVRR